MLMGRLLKLKQVDEPSDLEHVLDVVVHVAQRDGLALGLGLLEHVEQDAQAARCDVLQFFTFKYHILADRFGNGLQRCICLDCRSCIK